MVSISLPLPDKAVDIRICGKLYPYWGRGRGGFDTGPLFFVTSCDTDTDVWEFLAYGVVSGVAKGDAGKQWYSCRSHFLQSGQKTLSILWFLSQH